MPYTTVTTAQWRDRLRTQYTNVCAELGLNPPKWGSASFTTRIVDLLAFALAELSEGIGVARDSMSLARATGGPLLELAELMGVRPRLGTPSTVSLTVGAWNVGAVNLPKGAVVSDGTNRWVTTEAVRIAANSTATVVAQCEVNGPVSASANTITQRITSVTGWTSVTNPAAADVGTSPETEQELRLRASTSSVGSRSAWALKSALETVPGVQKAIVYYNPRVSAQTVSSRSVPACGWAVWLWPGPMTDATILNALAVIYKHGVPYEMSMPATSGATGVRAQRIGADGLLEERGFWYVRDINVRVAVAISTYERGYTLAKVQAAVQAAVQAYFDALEPGDAIRQNDLLGAVAAVTGVARATVTMSKQDPDLLTWSAYSNADITLDTADVGVLESAAAVT